MAQGQTAQQKAEERGLHTLAGARAPQAPAPPAPAPIADVLRDLYDEEKKTA
jgi:hypothetical protein